MAEKSKASAKSTKKYKFVKLAAGNVIWKDPHSGFGLNALSKEHFANLDNVPEKAKATIDAAVKRGLLEYTSDPDVATSGVETVTQTPLVNNSDERMKWTDKDSKESLRKSPSFTNRTLAIDSNDPVVQQAFKYLAASPAQAIDKITEALAALNKDEKETFARACLSIEKAGSNPAMKARTQVMDYLKKTFVDLGLNSGLGNVTSEQDPVVDNVKSIKFNV
tara:strand:+ start:30 stop:692 length:663 start_codon:yes stop_codon:yes gene_type:complete